MKEHSRLGTRKASRHILASLEAKRASPPCLTAANDPPTFLSSVDFCGAGAEGAHSSIERLEKLLSVPVSDRPPRFITESSDVPARVRSSYSTARARLGDMMSLGSGGVSDPPNEPLSRLLVLEADA